MLWGKAARSLCEDASAQPCTERQPYMLHGVPLYRRHLGGDLIVVTAVIDSRLTMADHIASDASRRLLWLSDTIICVVH